MHIQYTWYLRYNIFSMWFLDFRIYQLVYNHLASKLVSEGFMYTQWAV